jgi:hypothetical protein
VEQCNSLSANIVHEVNLYGKHLIGQGSYRQQRKGKDCLMRLELKIQIGDHTSSLLQVCDGQYLWTKRSLLDNKTPPARVNVAKVTQAIEQANATLAPGALGMTPSVGGLPRLLRGLHASFDFTTAELGRWGDLPQPVWRLQGLWKPQELMKVVPNQKEAIDAGERIGLPKFPEYLPDRVVVFLLAQPDPIPYRIEYRRGPPKKGKEFDPDASQALVTMELHDVDINVPIDPQAFVYTSPEYSDQTDSFIEALGLKPEARKP